MKRTSSTIVCAALFLCSPSVLPAQDNVNVHPADTGNVEQVYLPINRTVSKKLSTSSTSSYTGNSLEKYPGINIMNSFTGIIPGLFVTETTGATGQIYGSYNSSLWVRSFSTQTFIVDDVAIPFASELPLNPEEIESVTVISDIADKVKFGPLASRGAVYIKTLRGLRNTRKVYAGFEKGVDVVDIMPEYTNGVEYALLNNQAREAAGYPVRFTEEAIDGYRKQDPLDWVYPNVDYKSLVLKNTRDYNKGYVTIRGGNNNVIYSGNLGFVNQGDIYKVGKPSNYNRFNAKMDLGLNITRNLDFNFSFLGILSMRKSVFSGYGEWGDEQAFNNIYARIRNTPAVEYPLYLDDDPETDKRNYAISSLFTAHPYAGVLTGGYNERTRTGLTKASLNYDFSDYIKGLKSETQISYNLSYTVRGGQGEDYVAWLFNSADSSRTVTGHVGTKLSGEVQCKSPTYLQALQFHEKLLYGWSGNGHNVNASFTYYRSKLGHSNDGAYNLQQNYIMTADYNYRGKYIVDLVGNYAGTSARARGHRYCMFPAVGLGWVISEESWLKDWRWLDHLKLRGQAGVIGYEGFGTQYLWESYYTSGTQTFGPYTTNQWFGSSTTSNPSTNAIRTGNTNLGWEKNKEYSFGFDATLFGKLTIEYTHYNILRDGIVVDVVTSLPAFYGTASMYDNYNQIYCHGDELSATFAGRIGNFGYRVGGFLLHDKQTWGRYNEYTTYENLKHTGKSTGAIFGYVYDGKFATQEEADASIQTFDSQSYAGDLKYKDVTGDGIVNSNDLEVIGNGSPKLQYALNLYLVYKNFDFTIVGTGKAFFDRYLNTLTYFKSGWGDGNYSKFVYDDLYPRLSYVYSTNNFATSNYWKVDGSFFKIQNVELGYNIKTNIGKEFKLNNIRLFVRGANLLTISKVPYVDPENPEAGVSVYPLFKSFTGGLKLTF